MKIILQLLLITRALAANPPSCSETRARFQESNCCTNIESNLTSNEESFKSNLMRFMSREETKIVAAGHKNKEHDYNFYFQGDETQMVTSNSLSKPLIGLIAGVLEQLYPDFRKETLSLDKCLPSKLLSSKSVLSRPGLTLNNLLNMQAGVLSDNGGPVVSAFPGALGLKTIDSYAPISTTALGIIVASIKSLSNMDTTFGRSVNESYVSNLPDDYLDILAQILTLQHRVDDFEKETTDTLRTKKDFDFTKPLVPGYSTFSSNIAGICLQRYISNKETGNYDSFDVLKFENFIYEHVLKPFNLNSIRLGGDRTEKYPILGSNMYATIPDYLKLFDIFTDSDGSINGKQIVKKGYLDNYRKSYNNYPSLLNFRYYGQLGFFSHNDETYIGHGGAGGHVIYSNGETRGYLIVYVPISSAYNSKIMDRKRALSLEITDTEFVEISLLLGTKEYYDYVPSNTTSVSHAYGPFPSDTFAFDVSVLESLFDACSM